MDDVVNTTLCGSGPTPRQMRDPPYLSALNESQRAAVEAVDGPVLILAGAGTGKTRVLTSRLVHLLFTGRAKPSQLLAVTFTNKAAREMRERVAHHLGRSVDGWWVGTFHAMGARILRENAERVGLKASFSILDSDDQLRLLSQLIAAKGLDAKKHPSKIFLATIQRWKDRGLVPDHVTAAEGADAFDGLAQDLYCEYQQRLNAVNAVDFGDLILHVLTLFREHIDILEHYQRRFHFLLVDEYQDTNVAQYLWLRMLAQGHRNLCCVGDDDQSIYSWRGAEIANILRFEHDFPGARVIRLECNYRSTVHILAAASALIAHNRDRLGKTLWTPAAGGDLVNVYGVWDGQDEARVLCDQADALQRNGQPLRSMAFLVRAGFQTREFEERLMTIGLPYRIVGGARFYERQEIRDAIAYIRVLIQPDDDLAFERIINLPKRGIGAAALRNIHVVARLQKRPLFASAAALVETDELKPQARLSLTRLLDDFARWRGLLAQIPHPDLVRLILDESGYSRMWQMDRSPEAAGRIENLKELIAAIAEFESLTGFLEHVALVMENDEAAGDDKLTLMTLHAAKGLEFDVVFLPGWEEGIFPNQRALEEGGETALEEERRLAYVGLTRAKRRAIVSYAASRLVYGLWQHALPSRFIAELPSDHIDHTAPTGLFGASNIRARGNENPDLSRSFLAGANNNFSDTARNRPMSGPLIEGKAVRLTVKAGSDFSTGQRVFHQKFGYGRIQAVNGDRLEIEFEKAGRKTVIQSFVAAA
ncbi:MAG: UvrD-helicase domain-containing protein [Rhodospirillales bacterium]